MAEQPAGPTGPRRSRRAGLRLPRPWASRAAGTAAALAGDAFYRERRHPLWFFARSWLWLLLLAVSLPATLRAEGHAAQLIGGVLVLVSQLAILLRLVDWATTLVVIRPTTLQVIGYEGQHHTADLRAATPRIVQGRMGRTLGYAHLVTRRPGIRPKTSSQMFLSRPDELRRAVDAALRTPPGNR